MASQKTLETLRDLKPEWARDGLGVRGNEVAFQRQQTETHWPPPETGDAINYGPPALPAAPAANQTTAGASSVPNISFIVTNASTVDESGTTYKVHVADGKVTFGGVSTLPDGMGGGDFELIITHPEDALIYVLVTFDPETLLKTSVTLGVDTAAAIPESRVDETGGYLVFVLAFTYIDGDGVFQVVNRRVGDISFEFTYSAMNGQPALLPVFTDPGFLDLTSLFPP